MVSKKEKRKLLIKEERKSSIINNPKIPEQESKEISFNFRYIDPNQSTSHTKLEESKILSKFWGILSAYSGKTIEEAQTEYGNKFTIYKAFPKKNETEYECPTYIPEDVAWTRIHAGGKECLIGYVVGNIFYIVFLDPEHKFFLSKKKHT